MASIRVLYRSTATCALFVAFGIGAIALAPLMLVLRRPERAQPVIRASWRLAAWMFSATRVIRIDAEGLSGVRGSVLVANHPSLIDVVLLTALVPRTLYVAKRALRRNPFLAAIVRATALPDDASLPEVAAPHLARGWNVLIFPEGTRTPIGSTLGPFRRGAAQLALRTGAPVAAVGISVSRRMLGKRQRPWDVGGERVLYRLRAAEPIGAHAAPDESAHAAAVRVTAEIEARIRGLLRLISQGHFGNIHS